MGGTGMRWSETNRRIFSKQTDGGGQGEDLRAFGGDLVEADFGVGEIGDEGGEGVKKGIFGVGDADGALEFFAAPGVVVGDGEGSGVLWEMAGEAGEDEVVSFQGEPCRLCAAGRFLEGEAADAQDGGKAFLEGGSKFLVGELEEGSG